MSDEFLLNHRFSVEVSVGLSGMLGSVMTDMIAATTGWSGIEIHGYFTEVSGLDSEVSVYDYKTTTVWGEQINQQIPGAPVWTELVLSQGVTSDMGFWVWHEMILKGSIAIARANVSITMYDVQGSPKAKWDVDKAWPSKISGPALNAEDNSAAVEEITLVHEGIRRVSVNGLGEIASLATDLLF